jgi:transposase
MGARSVLAGLGDKQDRFSRWARNLAERRGYWKAAERRGYWKAAVAIAAKNLRLAWAVMHYGEDFRLATA